MHLKLQCENSDNDYYNKKSDKKNTINNNGVEGFIN